MAAIFLIGTYRNILFKKSIYNPESSSDNKISSIRCLNMASVSSAV